METKEHPYTREEAYKKFRENPEGFFDVVWHKKAETDGDFIQAELKRYDWWGGASQGLLTDNLLFAKHGNAASI